MAYRRNRYNTPFRHQRGRPFARGSFRQDSGSVGDVTWDNGYFMNQMGTAGYGTYFGYENEQFRGNKLIRGGKNQRCLECSESFNSSKEYRDHQETDSHKVKVAGLRLSRELPGPFDDEILEQVKNKKLRKESETIVETGPKVVDTDKVENKENDGVEEQVNEFNTAPETVIQIRVFYCKLCRTFLKNSRVAKQKHCSSGKHYAAYTKAMEVELKDEGRQSLPETEGVPRVAKTLTADETVTLREAVAAAKEPRDSEVHEQLQEEKEECAEMSAV